MWAPTEWNTLNETAVPLTTESTLPPIEACYPQDGFFARYMQYAHELTDAPDVYHLAAMLAVHSAVFATDAEVYFEVEVAKKNGEPIKRITQSPIPLWTLITGDSGDRKSTAVDIASDLAEPLIRDRIGGIGSTPEATLDLVAGRPDTFFCYSEGAQFFGQFFAPYWRHGQGIFPLLYDGRAVVKDLAGQRKKNRSGPTPTYRIEIPNPRVSLLVSVAYSHLNKAQDTDWTGGLIARMGIFYDRRVREQDFLLTNEHEQDLLRTELRQTYKAIRTQVIKQGHPIRLGIKPDALEAFRTWRMEFEGLRYLRHEKLQALHNRIPQHVLRYAAHYALSRRQLGINVGSMIPALNLGNWVATGAEMLMSLLTNDTVLQLADRIVTYCAHLPDRCIPIKSLSQILRVSFKTMNPAIEDLIARGVIKRLIGSDNGKYITLTDEAHKQLSGNTVTLRTGRDR